ncbi:MAG: NUDIX domain-containing protein [Patescibacteria group bacterium]
MAKRPKPIKGIRKLVDKGRRTIIKDAVREATAGGVIYRQNKKGGVEILLVQDAKDRWTIPKGHVEPGESTRQTAKREIHEETGLKEVDVQDWLGKISFQYRRGTSLILMTTQIYMVKALGDTDDTQKEDWMKGIKWFSAKEALDKIAYEDISKLMLITLKKIKEKSGTK